MTPAVRLFSSLSQGGVPEGRGGLIFSHPARLKDALPFGQHIYNQRAKRRRRDTMKSLPTIQCAAPPGTG